MFYNSDRLNHHNKIIPILKSRKRRQWCNIIELPSTVRGWSSDRRNPACVVSVLRCFFCFSDAGIVMWGCAAWQFHTRQKMGYDFARIGARQRCGETPGQERQWNRAATYFDGKFFSWHLRTYILQHKQVKIPQLNICVLDSRMRSQWWFIIETALAP